MRHPFGSSSFITLTKCFQLLRRLSSSTLSDSSTPCLANSGQARRNATSLASVRLYAALMISYPSSSSISSVLGAFHAAFPAFHVLMYLSRLFAFCDFTNANRALVTVSMSTAVSTSASASSTMLVNISSNKSATSIVS